MSTPHALVFVLALLPNPLRMQAQIASSIEVGTLTSYSRVILVGFRAAPARSARVGPDAALALFPQALVNGVVMGVVDLGLAYGVSISDELTLFPRLGGSALLGGEGGGSAVAGYSFGIGFLGRASTRLGVRFDYTQRRLFEGAGSNGAWLSSASLGLVWGLGGAERPGGGNGPP